MSECTRRGQKATLTSRAFSRACTCFRSRSISAALSANCFCMRASASSWMLSCWRAVLRHFTSSWFYLCSRLSQDGTQRSRHCNRDLSTVAPIIHVREHSPKAEGNLTCRAFSRACACLRSRSISASFSANCVFRHAFASSWMLSCWRAVLRHSSSCMSTMDGRATNELPSDDQ